MEDVLLECQVCFERYDADSRRPKIIPCGHTFCLSCLCASDNKCPNCRIAFRGSPMNLPDNFILLSATDNAPPPKKKAFWCLDCKKGADAECEDSHTICSMKKIISEQIGDLCEEVQGQLEKEETILNQLVVKLAPIKPVMKNLSSTTDREVTAHSFAKDEIVKIIQSIPEIENSPKDDSLESMKSFLSSSKLRLPTLEKKGSLLDLLADCEVIVKPSSSADSWSIKLNMSSEDLSDEHKALYYTLFKIIGRQDFDLPETVGVPSAAGGDVAASVPTSISPSPNGTCLVQVCQKSRMLGQIAISVLESIPSQKKDLLIKGLNGVKLYPKVVGALTGSLRTDIFFQSNNVKLAKGSVGIARSPLQPLSIYVKKPTNTVPKTGMFVWGKVVENLELLESILNNWATEKEIVVLSCPRWA
ncbi:E3 ubiquitin-protein ligase TRIM32-like [Thrips palmi]|uniref:E3 ubiquitin-protein ligase TRIM32-like n=1 Tax=Thrips palmi TaxID=161013 RepID=A0A6P9ACV5_THRPL|nr:E3 ubiquitin-protein ligase TRIM32-like [Thrips palmi]XP_034255311.1 E3 ubiquitin-protein ligase TRIM32-like [Thrips palmi]